MKNGFYLHEDSLIGNSLNNKIEMQIEAFSEFFSIKRVIMENLKEPIALRFLNIFPFKSFSRDYDRVLKALVKPDFIYIRMVFFDRKFVSFLSTVKSKFPSCKIIVEIPTYPYNKEWCATIYGRAMYIKDLLLREDYKRYIDRFVTYSYDDIINGVKTIQTMNGLDTESVKSVLPAREYDPHTINLIAVAFLMRHHGYERVIEGLKEYYRVKRDRKVYVSIIGEGNEKKKYECLVKKYNLTDYVKLHKPMYGNELDYIYNNADAGLAGFGFYKDGVKQVGTLKTREYLAKGLPVILGVEDRLFNNEGYKYGLLFPNDNSPIDIERVIIFLDELYLNREKCTVISHIRQFAQRTIDNRVTLAPIIDYIENDDIAESK